MSKAAHWIVKSEPSAYAWKDLVKDGRTAWTGVRNFQARNNLRAMRIGDIVLFYHSIVDKEVVGIARVAANAYADPTAEGPGWVCVDLVPVRPLVFPVPLEAIKANGKLREIALVRHSRLSVIPISPREYEEIVGLGDGRRAGRTNSG